jgi:hypothetical protein
MLYFLGLPIIPFIIVDRWAMKSRAPLQATPRFRRAAPRQMSALAPIIPGSEQATNTSRLRGSCHLQSSANLADTGGNVMAEVQLKGMSREAAPDGSIHCRCSGIQCGTVNLVNARMGVMDKGD